MEAVFLALGVLVFGAVLALVLSRWPLATTVAGVSSAVLGGVIGLYPAVLSLVRGSTLTFDRPWSIPGGSLALGLDPLAAWFLIPIAVVTAVAAIYGSRYLWDDRGRWSLGSAWFSYNLLTASMIVVVLARNGVLFLVAWEIMSLSSYFLVTIDDENADVRDAGRTYLIATHIGTAFLFALFVLLGRSAGSLDFAAILQSPPPGLAGLLFVFAVVGFGTKAGFMPVHVWLPEAHPAAPSHVSAVMSAVMVKTGIYGILRTLTLLPDGPAWWGWMLVGIGFLSGVWGILHAVAQHDIKRLLAYSTVENMGIIALGLGMGILGIAAQTPVLAILGFTGALLHVWNHALLKGLLFLGAGAVAHSTGTRQIDRMGGLVKRMPLVSGLIILGATAIAGLPPLNAFLSEFLIFLAAFRDNATLPVFWAIPAIVVIVALGVIGGLAAVAFGKMVGVALLGEPRTSEARDAHRPPGLLAYPIAVLAALAVTLSGLAPWLVVSLIPVSCRLAGFDLEMHSDLVREVQSPIRSILLVGTIVVVLLAVLILVRRRLLAGRPVGSSVTWDCGYAMPTVRMQYTGSSLVEPILSLSAEALRVRRVDPTPEGLFPADTRVATEVPDVCREGIFEPAFHGIATTIRRLRWIQQGTTHVYILYIALTLILLLIVCLGMGWGG